MKPTPPGRAMPLGVIKPPSPGIAGEGDVDCGYGAGVGCGKVPGAGVGCGSVPGVAVGAGKAGPAAFGTGLVVFDPLGGFLGGGPGCPRLVSGNAGPGA